MLSERQSFSEQQPSPERQPFSEQQSLSERQTLSERQSPSVRQPLPERQLHPAPPALLCKPKSFTERRQLLGPAVDIRCYGSRFARENVSCFARENVYRYAFETGSRYDGSRYDLSSRYAYAHGSRYETGSRYVYADGSRYDLSSRSCDHVLVIGMPGEYHIHANLPSLGPPTTTTPPHFRSTSWTWLSLIST